MSVSEATVDLLFKAQNLAGGAIGNLTGDIAKVGNAGVTAAGKFAGAFKGIGSSISTGIGQSVEQLASGGGLDQVMLAAGAFMAGELAQHFGEKLLERLAESSLIEVVAAPLAAAGTAMGGIIAAAIPIGMAALPFILIGALVAAVAILIVNPDIRQKVFDFVGGLIGHIADALGALAGMLGQVIPAAFSAAFKFVTDSVVPFLANLVELWFTLPLRLAGLGLDIVKTVIGGLAGLAGQVAETVLNAFASLHIDIGPFHISSSGVTVDLPHIDVPHFAVGTPYVPADMLAVVHKGEAILPARANPFTRTGGARPATAGAAVAGVTIQGVSERDILDMVDRGLYFRLQRRPSA